MKIAVREGRGLFIAACLAGAGLVGCGPEAEALSDEGSAGGSGAVQQALTEGAALTTHDASCLKLQDQNTWSAYASYMTPVGAALGVDDVLLDLNRAGPVLGSLNHPPAVGYKGGFRWNDGDMSTTDWVPQGMTAGVSGSANVGHRRLALRGHHGSGKGRAHLRGGHLGHVPERGELPARAAGAPHQLRQLHHRRRARRRSRLGRQLPLYGGHRRWHPRVRPHADPCGGHQHHVRDGNREGGLGVVRLRVQVRAAAGERVRGAHGHREPVPPEVLFPGQGHARHHAGGALGRVLQQHWHRVPL